MIINKVLGGRKTAPGGAYNVQQTIDGDNCEIDINSADHVVIQSKSVEITKDGANVIKPDDGFNAMSSVNINVNVKNPIEEYIHTFEIPTGSTTSPSSLLFESSDGYKFFIVIISSAKNIINWYNSNTKQIENITPENSNITRLFEDSNGHIFAWDSTEDTKYPGVWRFDKETNKFIKIFDNYTSYSGTWYSSNPIKEISSLGVVLAQMYDTDKTKIGTYRYDSILDTFVLITDPGVYIWTSTISVVSYGIFAVGARFYKWNNSINKFEILQTDIYGKTGMIGPYITKKEDIYYFYYLNRNHTYKYSKSDNKFVEIVDGWERTSERIIFDTVIFEDSEGNIYSKAHTGNQWNVRSVYIIKANEFQARPVFTTSLSSNNTIDGVGYFETTIGIFIRITPISSIKSQFPGIFGIWKNSDNSFTEINNINYASYTINSYRNKSPNELAMFETGDTIIISGRNIFEGQIGYVAKYKKSSNLFESVILKNDTTLQYMSWTEWNYKLPILDNNGDVWIQAGTSSGGEYYIAKYDINNNTLEFIGYPYMFDKFKDKIIIWQRSTSNKYTIFNNKSICYYDYITEKFIDIINTKGFQYSSSTSLKLIGNTFYLQAYINKYYYDNTNNELLPSEYIETIDYHLLKTGDKLYRWTISQYGYSTYYLWVYKAWYMHQLPSTGYYFPQSGTSMGYANKQDSVSKLWTIHLIVID